MKINNYKVSLSRYRGGMTGISFSSQKECREFINKGYTNTKMIFEKDQIKNLNWIRWKISKSGVELVRLGKIKKVKGLSIYLEGGIEKVSLREYNLYRILDED